MAEMSVNDAYNSWASTYDSDPNLTRDLDQRVTQETLGGLHCSTLLEIGCGTGKNTPFLAQIAERVYCLDFSEGMLRQAQAKHMPGNVSFAVADLTQPWPCADGSVDLVVCNLVLEHIADLPFIFAEAFGCLVEHGQLFVCELHPFKQYLGSKAVFQQGQAQVEIQAFVHHTSAFLGAASSVGLTLTNLKEWWHEDDQPAPPRLLSLMFRK